MPANPEPRTVDDELTLAVERDAALLERLGTVLSIVDRLIDRVAELERDLSDERVARERLELRINAQWLRDRGYTIASAPALDDTDGGDDAAGPSNVVPLIREYAHDTEQLPTTDDPTTDLDLDA